MAEYLKNLNYFLCSRKRIIGIVVPMLFGLIFMFLCIVNIGRSLSSNEIKYVSLIQTEFPAVLSTATENQQSPLYTLTLKTWSHFLGHTDFAMRMLSVLCGALTVLLICLIIRKIFGLRIALLASLLAATSPLLVALGQSINPWIFISLEALIIIYIIVCIALRCRFRLPKLVWLAFVTLLVFNICGLIVLYSQKPSAGKDLSQTIAVLDNKNNTAVICDSDSLVDVLSFYSGQKIYHETDFESVAEKERSVWFVTTVNKDGRPRTEYKREAWRVVEYSSMDFVDGNLYAIVKLEKE